MFVRTKPIPWPLWWLAAFRLAFITASSMLSTGLHAQVPQAGPQAPGFYRLKLGDYEVTALLDGVRAIGGKAAMRNVEPAQLEQLLDDGAEHDDVATSFNAFLVRTGDRLVLVDTGAGSMFGAGLGHLLENLRASGYQPEQIDEVLLTHLHVDHLGGLVAAGRAVFPNAMVRANKADADYWLSAARREAAPASLQPFFKSALEALGPYMDRGRFSTFEGDVQLLPGIRSMAAPGHTPGHTAYVVPSQGKQLWLWGDIVHMAVVQFPRPKGGFRADTDLALAAGSREAVFESAAKSNVLIGGAHLSFPGFGRLRAEGQGFRWLPLAYGGAP